MEDILITGSRGFVGSALRKVIKFPYDEIDLKLGTNHCDVKGGGGTLIFLSAWVEQNESLKCPTKYFENNLTSLSMIIENNSFSKIIFPSSSTVYDKDGNLEPISPYGLTKLASEKLIKMYFSQYWILRLMNPYGENDDRSVFHKLAECKKKKEKFPIFTKNGIMRDYFHVGHVANVINEILEGKIPSGIYNVGTGKGTTISSFMVGICEKHHIEYEFVESPGGLLEGFIPSDNLLRAEERDLEKEWEKYL